MKCPICETELVEKYYDSINMGCCEYLYVCENCKLYSDQFAYGGYETTIGSFTVHSAYNTPPDEQRIIDIGIKSIANEYKNTRYLTHPKELTEQQKQNWDEILK